MSNETILNADGTITVVGDAGSVSSIIADAVKANTVPAVLNEDESIKTAEVVPDANTLMVEITTDDLKTHAWRLPKVRVERLEQLRGVRNAKLTALDLEYQLADEGVHPGSLDKAAVAAKKVALRDLPPSIVTHLAGLTDTDDMDAYVPSELE